MILVVGGKGMLGTDLLAMWGEKARGVDLPEIDITNIDSVRRVLRSICPSVVVNCAAFTEVDRCEEVEEVAHAVNATGVGHLAEVSQEIGAKLVQVSTDYVFDGCKGSPYAETDLIAPLSAYGRTKAAGEEQARRNPDHLIVRTQWLYGLHGNNFVETMIRLGRERDELGVVDDQSGAPTWTVDLGRAITVLMEKNCTGTYHAVSSGSCTWHGFAAAIFAEENIDVRLRPITTGELGRPAPRPAFSVLDCGKLLCDTGLQLPPWAESLKSYLSERRRQHGAG